MTKPLWCVSVRAALLFSYALLALSEALTAQEQLQHDVITEMNAMKQHMTQHMTAQQHDIMEQKQQLIAQQQQMTTLQQQMNVQNQQLTEQKQKTTTQQQQIVEQKQQITVLQQHVSSQMQDLADQTRHMTEQKQRMTVQQQLITQQQQHIIVLQHQMKSQKHLLTKQSRQLTEHKEQLTAQQQRITALQTATHLEKQMTRRLLEDDIVTEVGTLKQQMTALQATQQKQGLLVATNAHLNNSFSPGPNQHIIYDDVSMNHGNAYSTVHGTFTAPYNGTYVFSVSACSLAGHFISLDLMRNAIPVKDILAGNNAYSDCASGTTMLDLHTGDTVWVRHRGSDGDYIYANYHRAVSFTGFLFHAS